MTPNPSSPIEQIREVLQNTFVLHGDSFAHNSSDDQKELVARISAIVVESLGEDEPDEHFLHDDYVHGAKARNQLRAEFRQQWSNQGEK